jgi:hypothetical protein
MFSETEFVEACAELDTPDVAEWEFFTESHGVKIYRQYNEVSFSINWPPNMLPSLRRLALMLST